tara:strand:- start:486 stop:1121 length:636 start_codon:yes stop_codon:yes gene_type:complete
MDEASRMARARKMGFDTDLYHGTNAPFSMGHGKEWTSLEPSVEGAMGPGIYLADPKYADIWAGGPSYRHPSAYAPYKEFLAEQLADPTAGSRYYPVKVRGKKLLEHNSPEWQELVTRSIDSPKSSPEAMVDLAKEAGYEGIYSAAEYGFGLRPQTVIFDPKNIRSRWAAFDPARRHSRDMLAGIAGLTATGAVSNALRNDQRKWRAPMRLP